MSGRVHTSVARVRRTKHDLVLLPLRPGTVAVDGIVRTPLGLVHATSVKTPHSANSYLEFVHRGKVYLRAESRAHSARGLATVAGRFARAAAAGRVR